jgi:CcmD family protein
LAETAGETPALRRIVMKNLNFLAAAYIAIWLIFCGYVLSVARRMASLRDEVRRLKQDSK